jgi:hypothetical protein
MEIPTPEPIEKDVTDYDFMFVGGSKLTITVDWEAGDTVDAYDDRYVIYTRERKNEKNPLETLDAEQLEVFKAQLAAVAIRTRKQRIPTEEELFDMRATIHQLARSVQ